MAIDKQMPRVGVLSVDIAVHTVLLHHEHFTARGEHGVDVERAEGVEGFPAPVEFGRWFSHGWIGWRIFARWKANIARSLYRELAVLPLRQCQATRLPACGRTSRGHRR